MLGGQLEVARLTFLLIAHYLGVQPPEILFPVSDLSSISGSSILHISTVGIPVPESVTYVFSRVLLLILSF